jgi:hypothetical protein
MERIRVGAADSHGSAARPRGVPGIPAAGRSTRTHALDEAPSVRGRGSVHRLCGIYVQPPVLDDRDDVSGHEPSDTTAGCAESRHGHPATGDSLHLHVDDDGDAVVCRRHRGRPRHRRDHRGAQAMDVDLLCRPGPARPEHAIAAIQHHRRRLGIVGTQRVQPALIDLLDSRRDRDPIGCLVRVHVGSRHPLRTLGDAATVAGPGCNCSSAA